jgi:hypothetical protein
MPGAYFSLNGAVAAGTFLSFEAEAVPKTAGAASIAVPVAVAFFMKFLLELSIIKGIEK